MSGEINISVLIRLAAEQARRDTAAFRADVDALGTTAAEAGRKTTAAGQAIDATGAAAQGAAAGVMATTTALAQSILQSVGVAAQMGRTATSIAGVQNAVTGLTVSMHDDVAAMLREQQAAAAWQAELDTLRARFVPLFAATQQYEALVRQISEAEMLGAISAQEATAARFRAEKSYQALATSITATITPVNQMMAAMSGAESVMQRQVAALAGIKGAADSAQSAQIQHGMMLDELRAKFNPLFAVSRQYEMQLHEITEAERLGAISTMEAAAARERAAQAMGPMTARLGQFGDTSRAAGAYAANLSFQMNDIFMMTAVGQSPWMLMMQQGPQVIQIMGQMRLSGLSLGTALSSALSMVMNPLGLLTMGMIGLGAAGVQWLMSLSGKTKTFDDSLKDLNTTLGRIRSNLELVNNVRLEDTFGSLTGSVRGLAQGMLELDRVTELKQLGEVLDTFKKEKLAPSFGQRVLQSYNPSAAMGGVPLTDQQLSASRYSQLGAANSFADFEVRAAEIKALAESGNVDAVIQKLQELQQAMSGGGAVTGMKDELRSLLGELQQTGVATAKIEAFWNGSAQASVITRQIDEMVQGYTQQAELAETSLRFGENSVQVEEVRARQARDALRIRLEEMKVQQGSAEEARAVAALEAKIASDAATHDDRRQKAQHDIFTDLGRQAALSTAILRHGEDSAEVEAVRARLAWDVQEARLAEMGLGPQLIAMAQQLFQYERDRAQAIKAAASAKQAGEMLSDLQEEASINAAILRYGQDSLQVKQLQIAAERRAFEQTLATMQVSAEMKMHLREAWEAARGLAAADPFGTQAAAGSYLRDQQERIEQLRVEQGLLGQNEAIQRRAIALWEVERDLRREGIDLTSARAAEIRAAAQVEFDLTRNIERQSAAWQNVQSAAESALDGIVEKLMGGDIEGALEAIAADVTGMFTELAIQNPLKNAILGTNYGTIEDVGGLKGIWGRLFGGGDPQSVSASSMSSVGAMQVTAATVTIGGPGAAAFMAGAAGAPANVTGAPGAYQAPSGDVQAMLRSVAVGGGARPDAISGLNGAFAAPLAAMIQEAQKVFGESAVKVSSAYRSPERQAELWQEALQKYGSPEEARRWVAPPGNSRHNYGLAADLQYSGPGVQQWMHQNAGRFGMDFRMQNEPWHIEPQNAGAMMGVGMPIAMAQAEKALAKLGTTAGSATGDLGVLGQGFGAFGNALGSAASGFAVGGAQGGLGGLLGSIGTSLGEWLVGALGIPGFATGGNHVGGLRIVGEKGPELEFTGPSTILPADLTRSVLAARSPVVAMAQQAPIDTRPVISINNMSSAPVSGEVEETTGPRGQRQYNLALSDAVAQGLTAPGGQARKTMRNYYGASPGPRRRS